MLHTVITFSAHWVAPVMTAAFFAVLPTFLDRAGK